MNHLVRSTSLVVTAVLASFVWIARGREPDEDPVPVDLHNRVTTWAWNPLKLTKPRPAAAPAPAAEQLPDVDEV
jgi:hypothetical protein